ncbi:MAG: glycosyltransferase [Oscillospiraceae bacterium]|nr:glycosyltransferase [Oscillospiraceae bacterium]
MTEDKIKVSICCATYNHEKYIRDSLEGFVSQKTDFKYEVIVHDDASTDKTADIIREYEQKYPDIIKPVYQKENQYSKKIRILPTYVYPKCRGEYVALCEGDDYWIDNEKLRKQVDFLDSNPDFSACAHNTLLFNQITSEKKEMYSPHDKTLGLEDVAEKTAYHTSSLMFRKKYLSNRPKFLDMVNMVGDYPLGIYLSLKGKIMRYGKVMSVYRINVEGSWTLRTSNSIACMKMHEETAAMLEEVNRYSEYKYNQLIKDIIKTKKSLARRCRFHAYIKNIFSKTGIKDMDKIRRFVYWRKK